jgi:hypothetical protein
MEEIAKDEENSKIKKARLWFYISGAFFITVLAFSFFLFLPKNTQGNMHPKNSEDKVQDVKKIDDKHAKTERALDGVLIDAPEASSTIYGVMIDNHVDARPEAGLEQAGLVFEAEAEGGITRYLALFPANISIDKIGPIRSARPYFIDWANEFNALYVHVGGSPVALAKIIDEDFFDINEFYNGGFFWRDETRLAPHNVYTSSQLLNKYIDKQKKNADAFLAWKFKEDADLAIRPDAENIEINFALDRYEVAWKYDKTNDNFIRYIAGAPQQTENSNFITAKNVAIMYVASEAIDDKLRLDLKNIGTGDALVCVDGKCQGGTWNKPSKEERTRFYIGDKEVEFNRGTTWIEVVKTGYKVSY